MKENDALSYYRHVKPENIFLTTSKGLDTITSEVNLDEARTHARAILALDCGEQWVDIYTAAGNVLERIERNNTQI